MIPATSQAFKDYKGGGGQSDNPYTMGSLEHDRYMWEMARLWNEEFRAIRKQLAWGG